MARHSGPSTATYIFIGLGTAVALAGAYYAYRIFRSEPATKDDSMMELRRSGRKVRRSVREAAHGVGEEAAEGAREVGSAVGDFGSKARKAGEMAARNVGYEGATEV